jgi:NDP-mannose synthase
MRAVILAGGRGTRLLPYTSVLPKPLVPVGDLPILEIIIHQLTAAGFSPITLALGYLGELIRAFVASRKSLASRGDITFVQEEAPTGTAGSLKLVTGLSDTFLVMNGDILTSLDYQRLIDFHRASGAVLTIATYQKSLQIDLGVLELDPGQTRVRGYNEKPQFTFPVSMGVYVFEPMVLDYIPADQYFDFPSLVLRLLAAGEEVACHLDADCIWLDLGRPEDFARAQDIFRDHGRELGLPGHA